MPYERVFLFYETRYQYDDDPNRKLSYFSSRCRTLRNQHRRKVHTKAETVEQIDVKDRKTADKRKDIQVSG
jgi:hypothetical protein